MKNIHLIPTNKPSRLWVNNLKRRLELDDDVLIGSNTAKHIYITSDEEIKEGDYIFETDSGYVNIAGENYYKNSTDFKIILTTDPDLIGVQSIDNEFLEWFVENPSCEEVEVINEQYTQNYHKDIWYNRYKIIIPEEEPKQIYYNTVGIENGVNVVKGQFNTQKEALDLANELNRKFPDLYYDWRETLIKEEPKQETLEEAAEKNYENKTSQIPVPTSHWVDSKQLQIQNFIEGAKWQAERMYSKEEAYKIWKAGQEYWKTSGKSMTFEELTEQFKKKSW